MLVVEHHTVVERRVGRILVDFQMRLRSCFAMSVKEENPIRNSNEFAYGLDYNCSVKSKGEKAMVGCVNSRLMSERSIIVHSAQIHIGAAARWSTKLRRYKSRATPENKNTEGSW